MRREACGADWVGSWGRGGGVGYWGVGSGAVEAACWRDLLCENDDLALLAPLSSLPLPLASPPHAVEKTSIRSISKASTRYSSLKIRAVSSKRSSLGPLYLASFLSSSSDRTLVSIGSSGPP